MSKRNGAGGTRLPQGSVFEWLPVADLRIDPEAQRTLKTQWVAKKVPHFDPDKFGHIVVNIRADGHAYVIDGQHRVALVREALGEDQKVPCEVFRGLVQAGEADQFLGRQDKTAVQPFDEFRIRVTAGDPVACDIQRIVLAAGLTLAAGTSPGRIAAVTALERVYRGCGISGAKDSAKVLARTLRLIVEAWGRERANLEGHIIEGLGIVLTRYGTNLNEKHLIEKLAKFPGGGAGLTGKARGWRETHGGTKANAVGRVIVREYNRGHRSGKLDDWGA